jgi:hypothetical protein
MPSEAEFEAALAETESFASDFDLGIERLEPEETEEGQVVHIRLDDNDGHTCIVTGRTDLRYFIITYPYDYISSISNGIDSSHSEEIIESSDIELEYDRKSDSSDLDYIAARHLLSNQQDERLSELGEYIKLYLNGSGVKVEIVERDEVSFAGFNITGYIFPYEKNYGFKEFADSIHEVLNVGRRGSALMTVITTLRRPDAADSGSYELNISIS